VCSSNLYNIRSYIKMDSVIKSGELTYYSRGVFTDTWKEGYFRLLNNGTIQWFAKPSEKNPEGNIFLRNVAQYICAGPYARNVPGRPDLPNGADFNLLLCFPRDPSKKEKDICWILCKDSKQLNEWMSAIVSLLPPPPQMQPPPQQQPPQQQPPQWPSQEKTNIYPAIPASTDIPPPPSYVPATSNYQQAPYNNNNNYHQPPPVAATASPYPKRKNNFFFSIF